MIRRRLLLLALFVFGIPISAADRPAATGGAAPLHRIVPATPARLRELMHYDGFSRPIVSAHRGGADVDYPENCLKTFERTLRAGFALLEIDPRYTQDGHVVVHHDSTLERTTTGQGPAADQTISALKQLHLKDRAGTVTDDRLITLDEAIEWARGKTVLVLDQKDVPVLERARIVTERKAEAFVMLIVTNFKEVRACYDFNPEIMMEVMIPDQAKVREFDELGVPWSNVIAFVGHKPPTDRELYRQIHNRGARCMIGTSRNLDRQLSSGELTEITPLEPAYRELLGRGADVIETDIPVPLATLLYSATAIPGEFLDVLRVE
ncbi:MAG: glycerophosphodiester phosphodiesterase family protein [Planctomycetaceae bacterium]